MTYCFIYIHLSVLVSARAFHERISSFSLFPLSLDWMSVKLSCCCLRFFIYFSHLNLSMYLFLKKQCALIII